ncbi:RICIN domain-containing protein [Actinosynnema sp. NPDC004786]
MLTPAPAPSRRPRARSRRTGRPPVTRTPKPGQPAGPTRPRGAHGRLRRGGRRPARPSRLRARPHHVQGRRPVEDAGGGYSRVVNQNSGKCLDVVNSGAGDGADIPQYTRGTGANRQRSRTRT